MKIEKSNINFLDLRIDVKEDLSIDFAQNYPELVIPCIKS